MGMLSIMDVCEDNVFPDKHQNNQWRAQLDQCRTGSNRAVTESLLLSEGEDPSLPFYQDVPDSCIKSFVANGL